MRLAHRGTSLFFKRGEVLRRAYDKCAKPTLRQHHHWAHYCTSSPKVTGDRRGVVRCKARPLALQSRCSLRTSFGRVELAWWTKRPT